MSGRTLVGGENGMKASLFPFQLLAENGSPRTPIEQSQDRKYHFDGQIVSSQIAMQPEEQDEISIKDKAIGSLAKRTCTFP